METVPLSSYLGSRAVRKLFYITHIDNIPSILSNGIFSHELIKSRGIRFTPIYDEEIVSNRRERRTPNDKSLWNFANLYLQPRNPMLYRVICEKSPEDVAVLGVRSSILSRSDIFVSLGNAASPMSEIVPFSREAISRIAPSQIDKVWWTETDGSKRTIMAECLVPDQVASEYIQEIYVASHEAAEKVNKLLHGRSFPIIPQPDMFFQPSRKSDVTSSLSVVDGDMFFSRLHALTVSVNTVGIMGKGLASRTKYQFPDVYVNYQDHCRKGSLKMGKPYLYKRESSLDYQLADEPSSMKSANTETWFILFPTKRHWSEKADIVGIEKGLRWIRDNYKIMRLKSLAVPALGCGLGRLEWKDVGPLMCRYLSELDITTRIYLPAEKKIPDEFLTKDYLLAKSQSLRLRKWWKPN